MRRCNEQNFVATLAEERGKKEGAKRCGDGQQVVSPFFMRVADVLLMLSLPPSLTCPVGEMPGESDGLSRRRRRRRRLSDKLISCFAASAPFFRAWPLVYEQYFSFYGRRAQQPHCAWGATSLSLSLSLSHSPCESDEIQHVKKTSHVDDGAEPEFCVTVALASSSWMDG